MTEAEFFQSLLEMANSGNVVSLAGLYALWRIGTALKGFNEERKTAWRLIHSLAGVMGKGALQSRVPPRFQDSFDTDERD